MSIYKSSMTFGQVYHNAVTSKGERITGISAVEHSELVFDYMIDYIESLEYDHDQITDEFQEAEDKTADGHNDKIEELTDTITDLEKQVCELEDENDKLTEQLRKLL